MSTEADNLAQANLRRLDAKMDTLSAEFREVKERLSSVELGLVGVRRELAALAETDARLQAGMDRMGDRMARLEGRLDLSSE